MRWRRNLTLVLLVLAFCAGAAHGSRDEAAEEFSISSPDEIDELVATAVRESRKELKDGENALDPKGPMFKSAEESARRRLVYKESPTLFQRKQDLLGDMRSQILQLSGRTQDAEDGDDDDDHKKKREVVEAYETGLVGRYEEDFVDLFLSEAAAATGNGTTPGGVALRSQAEVFMDTVKLGRDITDGAISLAGALPSSEAEPLSSVNIVKVPWLAAVGLAEEKPKDHGVNETAFEEWYGGKMGGKVSYVTRSQEVGQASPLGVLVAEEDVKKGDVLLEMPLKCILNQLSLRNRRIRAGFVGEKLKEAFAHNPEWGLSVALLFELAQHRHGDGSKWGAFLDTLEMRLLGTPMVQELEGTFAAELLRIEEEEVQEGYRWVSSEVCKSDNSGICNRKGGGRSTSGVFTSQDFRWALSVVKQNAVPLKLETTGREYLSLIPYANLAQHDPDAGGEVVLSLKNVAEFRAGVDVAAFHPVKLTKGTFTDAESFLRYHLVSEHVNRFNHVRLKIPGGGQADDQLIYKVQSLRDWRKAVGLPPRAADLWRAASQLNLYGEDEEEQNYMDRQNRLTSGTNLEPITRAEQLMLTGKAKTNEEAALMIKPAPGSEVLESKYSESQLYSAPDLEEDISLEMAAKNLKEAAHQLHISVALNLTGEGSVGKVVNDTRNFFLYGTAPSRGLDAIDEMLIKKMDVLSVCGGPRDFVIQAKNVSEELLCAMRVSLSNETELNLIEASFNRSMGITKSNEMLMLQTLEGSVRGLLRKHITSTEEDEAQLESDDLSAKKRFAVTLRLREKELLQSALAFLEDEIEGLEGKDPDFFQVAALLLQEEEKQRRLEDLQQKLGEERERLSKKAEIVSVTINVQKAGEPDSVESANLTIYEGDDLGDRVREFGDKHALDQVARKRLEMHVKNNIPPREPIVALLQTITQHGSLEPLGLARGENATDKVERFLLTQGVLEESEDKFKTLAQELEEKLRSRSSARLLVEIPVVAPDGRKLTLHIREGEQHDMLEFMRVFAKYAKLPSSSIQPLAQEALRRLPPAILQVPINLGGSRQLSLRVASGDVERLEEVISSFCDRHAIQDESAQQQIMRNVLSKIHPGASLL
ncbi:Rubisco LSMT substrate-binding domain-containing protein [Chloropicon primus]|nr:Rubisco LSMT substrate-binding domain-containing protein [Chloropicon primus]